ncbi:MAG: pentapeptide repeat-containing protein [Caldilineales bacterium]|nr:pentapeptide repeat-containing protein [Caldilineales bacterium]
MSNTNAFVGRDRQLAQLAGFLDQSLTGHGQICFVTGDAGAGKTTLALEFMRQALARQQDLVAAVAMGDPQTGASDPYLIFREILTLLTGDVESRLAQGTITQEGARRLQGAMRTSIDCLIEFGPDLIGLLVPGANLAVQVAKIGIETGKRAGLMDRLTQAPSPNRPDVPGQKGIDQGQIFEQYAKVLKALSQHAPLMLILDDLQWADNSSIDLLFHLARRIESSRIFIIGMYRPAEIALGRAGDRHPLEKVVTEIKRYYGDVIIDLDEAGRDEGIAFIDALIDSEPNRLGSGFRKALFERTGGNPLFTVELLRDLEEQGDIVRDEQGRWVESPELNWATLPARAEGVIEARISRLTADLLEALKLASVQGDAFTAEVVAQIRDMSSRDFVRQLSNDLEKRHRLVSSQGQQRVGEQRLSQYQFQNRLFQQYLYAALDPTERAYLHEDIGLALEALYGDKSDDVANRLAWHFEEAGIPDKARHYLRVAGEQAAERYAFAEAADFFTRALAIPANDDLEERYALVLGRVKASDNLGRREMQGRDVTELERLGEALGGAVQRADAAFQRATYEESLHDYAEAVAACERAIAAAQEVGDIEREVKSRNLLASTLNRKGDSRAALAQAEQIMALAETAGLDRLRADAYLMLGKCEKNLENVEAAQGYLEKAQALYRALGDRRGESKSAEELGWLLMDEGEFNETRKLYDFALTVNRERGDRRGELISLNNLGGLAVAMGDLVGAQAYFEQLLPVALEIDERLVEGASHVNLSSIHRMKADFEQALDDAQQAQTIFEDIQSPYGQSHAWLRSGHALAGLGRAAEAIAAYENAIAINRQLGTPTLALESLAGLVRVHLAQGDNAQALIDLQPILDHLAAGEDFEGTEEPLWIYLTCYEALSANDDPRADEFMAEAYRQLIERADRFADGNARRMFLTNIPHHRQIFKAVTGQDPEPVPVPAVEPSPIPSPAADIHSGEPPVAEAAIVEPSAVVTRPEPAPTPAPAPPPVAVPDHPAEPNRFSAAFATASLRLGEAPLARIAAAVAAFALLLILLLQIPALVSSDNCPPQCAGADLAGKNWRGEELVGGDFSGSDLYGARLESADLTAATLISATLAAADLSYANLRGADLRQANLRGANLSGADLTSADLTEAVLIGADLTNANLTDADLGGANMAAVILDGAILIGYRNDTDTRWPYGYELDINH